MLEKILRIGDKIEIKRIANLDSGTLGGKYYVSQLLDINDDTRINIGMPFENGKMIPLDIGERYQMCFYTHNGLLQSKGLVVERFRNNNLYVAAVKFIADFEKLQRRQFYRLECILEITYRIISEREQRINEILDKQEYENTDQRAGLIKEKESIRKEWHQAVATDISGGGIRFNSKTLHEDAPNIEIRLQLFLDGKMKMIETRVHVVYSAGIPARPGMYEYRAEFMGISMKDREQIIRFVFDEERKRRKREKE